ncbi:drug/metabolite exporter YedA [Polyangium jinanense]|uniref:Drug/metabolite exporter YedA n=2 Tax=Polyangium jinanense TaxID=2829994 RepID=A0A9X4AXG7_9BACT|nr:drug/metabolite exporter YedA [Polyangium jinanense]MDC3987891.1 drug/metabolite exporter YedA [Polyangium jinanense]
MTTVPRFRAGVASFAPRPFELDLAKGALWAQRLRGPFALACTSGSVWLTREGDPDDVVLSAGGCYRGADQGLVVVEALSRAHITVSREGFSGKLRRLLAVLRQQWLVLVSLFSLYVIWGSTYLGMHIALETLPPFFMGGTRFVLAGGILYGVLRLRGEAAPSRKQWAGAALVGSLLLACGNGFLAIGQQRGWVSSGVAAVVVTTMPLWMAVLGSAAAFVQRRMGREGTSAAPSAGEWTGLLVGFTGATLLHLGGAMGGSGGGILLLMLSPFAWALGSLLSRSLDLPKGLMASAAQMIAGGVIMLSLAPLLGEPLPLAPSARSLAALAYLTVFGSIVGFSAYGYLIRNTRPAIATSYAYVNPLVAIALGIWLGGEAASATTWLAAIIVISGVVIVSMARARPSTS